MLHYAPMLLERKLFVLVTWMMRLYFVETFTVYKKESVGMCNIRHSWCLWLMHMFLPDSPFSTNPSDPNNRCKGVGSGCREELYQADHRTEFLLR